MEMNRWTKRIVASLLVVVLLISGIPVICTAATKPHWIVYTETSLAEEAGHIEAIPYAEGYYLVYDNALLQQMESAGIIVTSAPDETIMLTEEPSSEKDPGQSAQWYLTNAGYSAARKAGLDGRGVKVAIIDSGCRLGHEDLWDMKLIEAKSFLKDNNSIQDEANHGTAVTGILAAAVDNGVGISGLAPKAEYFILRVFSATGGTESSLVSALGYAINCNVDVINMSLGSTTANQRDVLQPLIQKANQKGIILVSAVGNSGNTELTYPAGYSDVIGVGSVAEDGKRSSFSNYNKSVDILAPGETIYALNGTANNAYKTVKGTSFASPIVAGLAIWAKQIDKNINHDGFLKLLQTTSIDGGPAGYDTQYGWGSINGNAYVAALKTLKSVPFEDIKITDWFYDPVVWAYESGMMNGTGATTFHPQGTLTRAMVVSMLYRYAGSPTVEGDAQFTDVANGMWYTTPVLWAAKEGVVQGVGDGLFAPNTPITREQFVMILYRYAKATGMDMNADINALKAYRDAGKIDSWAVEAMSWAVTTGLMRGSEQQLSPLANATRAQAASLLQSFAKILS